MLDYIGASRLIKFGHLLLGKPHSLPGKLHIDAGFPVLALVYDYLIIVGHY